MFNKITNNTVKKICSATSILTLTLGLANTASATIVEFQTSQGNFQVNLFDTTTPATVNNFLNYVNDEHYTDSVVHRVATDFVVQAGGYEFSGEWPLTPLVANASVINEPIYSNVKGTIAMAKQGGNPNSATNQWFFNLKDNNDTSTPDNLDRQNGGFTTFGQVMGDGMLVVEKIAQLRLCTAGSLQGVPMVMTDDQTCADMAAPGIENFAVIKQIVIVDSSDVTDADLHPLLSKYPDSDGDGVKDIDDAFPSDPTKSVPDAKDSGGSITWFSLVMLGLITARRRFLSI